MAFVLSDRIKETTTTTGTGTYTLGGAVSGFETFTANLSNSDTTYYCCTDGTDFEVGLGTFASSGTTLARTTIISSSNSNNAVSWSSGSRDIFCTLPGSKAVFKNGDGDVILADNEEIKLGDSSDLVIRHAGSNSLIEDNGGGSLIVKANPIFKLEKSGTSELMIEANADGAVELYHDNSKKLETESTGVKVTGNLEAEDGYIGFGDISADNWGKLEFLSSDPTGFTSQFGNAVALDNEQGSTNQQLFLFDTGATNDDDLLGLAASGSAILSITGQGDIKFLRPNGSTSHDITLACPTPSAARTVTLPDATGTVALTSDITVTASSTTTFTNKTLTSPTINGFSGTGDASITGDFTLTSTDATNVDGPIVKLTRNSASPAVNDIIGSIRFLGKNDAAQDVTYAEIDSIIFDETDGTENGALRFTVPNNGTQTVYQTLGDNKTLFNQKAVFIDNIEAKFGTGSDGEIKHTGSNFQMQNSTGDLQFSNFANDKDVDIRTDDGSGSTALYFKADGSTGEALLYHYGTEKIKTTSDGATVTGDLTVTSTDAGSSDGPILKLFRDSSSPANNDELGEVRFHGRNSANEDINYGGISCSFIDVTDGTEDTRMEIKTRLNGSIVTYYQAKFGLNEFRKPIKMFENTNIVFEGGTADANETTLTVEGPTADRTITLPDATGTVLTTGNSDTPTTTTSSSDADFVLVDDGGTMKKITPSNLGITSGGASKGFAVAMAIAL